jgi:hypothetical protein
MDLGPCSKIHSLQLRKEYPSFYLIIFVFPSLNCFFGFLVQNTVYTCFPELLVVMKKRKQREQRILTENSRI